MLVHIKLEKLGLLGLSMSESGRFRTLAGELAQAARDQFLVGEVRGALQLWRAQPAPINLARGGAGGGACEDAD